MEVIKGIGVSRGIGIGKAIIIDKKVLSSPHYSIKESNVKKELKRFTRAISKTKKEIKEIKSNIETNISKDVLFILDAHLMLLEDKSFLKRCITTIKKERINAEWAIEKVIKEIEESFEKISDEYIKERGRDVEQVFTRVLKNFREVKPGKEKPAQGIIIASDLSPADTAQFKKDNVFGIATDMGTRTSHTAILARAMNIPAVVGLERITTVVETGDTIIVDGQNGIVIVNPTIQILNEYLKNQRKLIKEEKQIKKLSSLKSITADGVKIRLMANIELLDELGSVIENGAEGIGLFRTEFLYLNRTNLPEEEEHFDVYRKIAEKIAPMPAIIRTVDIGGDKLNKILNIEKETNPALGLRAIRLCLKNVELFKTQLRGILRASSYGNIKILLPMIADINEVRQAKSYINEIKAELSSRGINFNKNIPVGVMIETPSASIIPDILAREVDFFSIGTNDLIQYSLAIDRSNEHVAYLYNPLHPAILRFIKNIINAGNNAGIEVNLCGEMAADAFFVPILIGLGLRQLSMDPQYIPLTKRIINQLNLRTARAIANNALKMSNSQDIAELIKKRFGSDILSTNFV
jgi:phosphotransferase system enzyme I (PtsI)